MIKQIILHFYQSVGDCIAATMAVEMLHSQHAGKYETAVSGPPYVLDIFKNNPWIKPVPPTSRVIKMQNPLVTISDISPVHYCHSYCYTLSQALGINLAPTTKRPSLYLSDDERSIPPLIKDKPYIVINAGFKGDFEVKHYPHWQEVVDYFEDKYYFVQVGEEHHNHTPLKGNHVINMIGKTTLREFIVLCYHSKMGLGPESAIGHVYGALEKYAVIVASGAWPQSFYSYPNVRYLTRFGTMDCCKSRSCGRTRVTPSGVIEEDAKRLCLRPDGTVPSCLSRIKPLEVILAMEAYLHHN